MTFEFWLLKRRHLWRGPPVLGHSYSATALHWWLHSMKFTVLFLTFVCLSPARQIPCSAAPLVKPKELPDLQPEADSESLLELTHYTAQGFAELSIHEQPESGRVVFELAREASSRWSRLRTNKGQGTQADSASLLQLRI